MPRFGGADHTVVRRSTKRHDHVYYYLFDSVFAVTAVVLVVVL